MRIAVIYNEPKLAPASEHWLALDASGHGAPPHADASELGVLDEVAGIDELLRAAGHQTSVYAVSDVAGVTRFLDVERPELIFNVCESLRGDDSLTMAVAGVFDLLGVPYTGSSALTLGLALDKAITKALFRAYGVPTPAYALVEPDTSLDRLDLCYPLIVKPVREDASNGITAASVVTDADQLAQRVRFIWRAFDQPALVEEYIDGRELNAALLAASPSEWIVLPISEITFEGYGDQPRIVCYESKWVPASAAYHGTVPCCPAALPDDVVAQVHEVALRAARAVGLRDYGRIDLRLRADKEVFVLEANPNPDISRDAGFLRAAAASGRSHAATICEIVERAAERAHLSTALDRAS
jgi:D-alanine-D-alanine ligase